MTRPRSLRYLDEVARYYDAVLMQPIVAGDEYRVFVLDDEVLYCARKHPPFVIGDGVRSSARSAGRARCSALRGTRHLAGHRRDDAALDRVPAAGERCDDCRADEPAAPAARWRWTTPADEAAPIALARRAVRALGLRLGAVDLFTGIGGRAERSG